MTGRRPGGALLARALVLALAIGAVPAAAVASVSWHGVATSDRAEVSVAGWRQASVGRPPAASATVSVELVLRPRNPARLAALVAAQHDPSSPDYHRWLTPAEYGAEFGPDGTAAGLVRGWASRAGLHLSGADGELALSGSASAMGRAFGTKILSAKGTYATTSPPSLPAGVASELSGVVSGDLPAPVPLVVPAAPREQVRAAPALPGAAAAAARLASSGRSAGRVAGSLRPSRSVRPATSGGPPTPCAAAAAAASSSLSAAGAHYGVAQLQSAGDLGQGETVGIYEASGFSMGDIDAYEACLGVSTQVTAVQVAGGGDPGVSGSLEADLDIEEVIAQAPDARVVVYDGGGTSTDSSGVAEAQSETWQAIVDGATVNGSSIVLSADGWNPDPSLGVGTVLPPPQIVSTSWGWYWSQGVSAISPIAEVLDPIFEQSATEGTSLFAASGDSDDRGVVYPADSPYVTGTGGSVIEPSGPDQGWVDSTGGFSPYESEPAFEKSVETASSARGVPDVAGDAENLTVLDESPPLLLFGDETSGRWSVSDAGKLLSCQSLHLSSGCAGAAPGSNDTYTVSYAGASGAGPSSVVMTADGAATTAIELVEAEQDTTLYAYVDEPFALEDGQPLPAVGGTVSFGDADGDVPAACSSEPVGVGGVAVCAGVNLATMASAGDTLSVSYSGSTTSGPSSASAGASAGTGQSAYTSPEVVWFGDTTPNAWYLTVYPIGDSGDWPFVGGVGGTSAAAPLWAGLVADVDDTCSAPIGEVAAGIDELYGRVGNGLYGTLLDGVVAGTTSSDGYTTTAEGWNAVTGLGTPLATGMVCPQLTGISESSGRPGDTVTVSGTNLSLATFSFGAAAASVTSQTATSATLVVPPGSGQVQVSAAVLGAGDGVPFGYQQQTTTSSSTSSPTTTLGTGFTTTTRPPTTTTHPTTTTSSPVTTTSLATTTSSTSTTTSTTSSTSTPSTSSTVPATTSTSTSSPTTTTSPVTTTTTSSTTTTSPAATTYATATSLDPSGIQTLATLPADVVLTATVTVQDDPGSGFPTEGAVQFLDNGEPISCGGIGADGSYVKPDSATGEATCTDAIISQPNADTGQPLNRAIVASYSDNGADGVSTETGRFLGSGSSHTDELVPGGYAGFSDLTTGALRIFPNEVSIDRAGGSDDTLAMMEQLSELYTDAGLYGCTLDVTNGACAAADVGPNHAGPDPATTQDLDNYSRTEELQGVDVATSGAVQAMLCQNQSSPLPYDLSRNNPSSTPASPILDYARSDLPASACPGLVGLPYAEDEVDPTVWTDVNPGVSYHAYIDCPASFGPGAVNTAGPDGATLLCGQEAGYNAAYYVAPNTAMPAGDVLIDSTTGETAANQTSGSNGAVAEGNVPDGWLPGDNPTCSAATCDGASLQSIDNQAETAGNYGQNYYENGDPAAAVPSSPAIPTPTENGDGTNAVSYRLWCESTPYTPGSWNAATNTGTAANPGAIRDWGNLTDLYTGDNATYSKLASDNVGYGVNIGVPVNVIGVNTASGTYATLRGFAGLAKNSCGGLNANSKSDEVATIDNNAAQAGVLIAADCHQHDAALPDANPPGLGLVGAQLADADAACTASQLGASVYFMANGVYATNAYARTSSITFDGVTKSYPVSEVNLDDNATGPGLESVVNQSFSTFRLLSNIYQPSQVRLSTADFLNYMCDDGNHLYTKGTDYNTGLNFDHEITDVVDNEFGFYRIGCDIVNAGSYSPAITAVADPNS